MNVSKGRQNFQKKKKSPKFGETRALKKSPNYQHCPRVVVCTTHMLRIY